MADDEKPAKTPRNRAGSPVFDANMPARLRQTDRSQLFEKWADALARGDAQARRRIRNEILDRDLR